MKEVKSTV